MGSNPTRPTKIFKYGLIFYHSDLLEEIKENQKIRRVLIWRGLFPLQVLPSFYRGKERFNYD